MHFLVYPLIILMTIRSQMNKTNSEVEVIFFLN